MIGDRQEGVLFLPPLAGVGVSQVVAGNRTDFIDDVDGQGLVVDARSLENPANPSCDVVVHHGQLGAVEQFGTGTPLEQLQMTSG